MQYNSKPGTLWKNKDVKKFVKSICTTTIYYRKVAFTDFLLKILRPNNMQTVHEGIFIHNLRENGCISLMAMNI